jgi:uncharacterized protein YdhG (YjbR/CyaY superfamily)
VAGLKDSRALDAYIAQYPPPVRAVLRRIRATVRRAAPQAHETIRYGIPTFVADRVLLHFAAFTRHIGLYPPVRKDARLLRALAPFAGPKGNLRLPLDRPIPYALITRVVKLRLKEDRANSRVSRAKRSDRPEA